MPSTLSHLDSALNHRYTVSMTLEAMAQNLTSWYQENQRDLPWRSTKDPYRIWISETMLQQTTSRAVIPFYKRFLKSFPTVKKLAAAKEEQVLENWAGLGYYSRARNLHKAAQIIAEKKAFPKTTEELLPLPGLGPYTARAVASIAFEEPVGVVDGNTIRVISRIDAWKGEWWKTAGRQKVQNDVDQWAKQGQPSMINQALMELGATVCTPTSPNCLLCPIKKGCKAFASGKELTSFPAKKPKRAAEIWVWKPELLTRNGKVALIRNKKLPFLKDQWILPGKGKKLQIKPSEYDYTHSITHHKIYVQIQSVKKLSTQDKTEWAPLDSLARWCPVSLVQKAIDKKGLKGR